MEEEQCAVYRHFDKNGDLLYVGQSTSALRRTMDHKNNAHWYRSIVRIEIEWCVSREAALFVEEQAIKTEGPKFNRTGPYRKYRANLKCTTPEMERKKREILERADMLGIDLDEGLCLAALQVKLYEAKKLLKRAS